MRGVALSIFGLALVLSGLFQHAPIVEGVIFNVIFNAEEDKLHSVFATMVGFSFTLYAVSSAFIEKAAKHRIIDIIVGFTATMLSLLMLFCRISPAYGSGRSS